MEIKVIGQIGETKFALVEELTAKKYSDDSSISVVSEIIEIDKADLIAEKADIEAKLLAIEDYEKSLPK